MTRNPVLPMAVAAFIAALAPGFAQAAPAQASGVAQANVVVPGSVVPIDALRFGQFMQPTVAGTISVDNSGAVTTTSGVTAGASIAQTGTGRGPGSFDLAGSPNRQTDIVLPLVAVLTSGLATMTVDTFNANTNGGGKLKLDATGHATLTVGATLHAGANQAIGTYTGTYVVTVAFQ